MSVFQRWRCTLLLLGFMSGLPFLLTLSTLSFRLAESGIKPTHIGLLVCMTIPYALKFLWAPFIDRAPHKRKGVLLVAQAGMAISLVVLGILNPDTHLGWVAVFAFIVSLFAATQDIVIEIVRIQWSENRSYGLNTAFETIGFRCGMIVSGAGALYLAEIYSWSIAYTLMAACLLVFMPVMTLLPLNAPPAPHHPLPTSTPVLKHLLKIFPPSTFIPLILFIFFFKYCDILLNAMSAPFLYDCGYSKIEYANITKIIGMALMLLGSLLGGLLMDILGHKASITICILLQSISCFLFVIQSIVGYDPSILLITVGIESLSSGVCATVLITYLSSFCHKSLYTGTFFTGLYSVSAAIRIIISVIAGPLADLLGWTLLFGLSTIILFPTLWAFKRLETHPTLQKQHLSNV
jgi:MFS transporter, PAT family, beta-lactamase induction signal transducer AmpG